MELWEIGSTFLEGKKNWEGIGGGHTRMIMKMMVEIEIMMMRMARKSERNVAIFDGIVDVVVGNDEEEDDDDEVEEDDDEVEEEMGRIVVDDGVGVD
jgi:hypothetical protein